MPKHEVGLARVGRGVLPKPRGEVSCGFLQVQAGSDRYRYHEARNQLARYPGDRLPPPRLPCPPPSERETGRARSSGRARMRPGTRRSAFARPRGRRGLAPSGLSPMDRRRRGTLCKRLAWLDRRATGARDGAGAGLALREGGTTVHSASLKLSCGFFQVDPGHDR